jgi:hypothetical protein
VGVGEDADEEGGSGHGVSRGVRVRNQEECSWVLAGWRVLWLRLAQRRASLRSG